MSGPVGAPIRLAAALAAAAWTAGCMHPGPYDEARVGPFFVPSNVEGEATTGGLRRVVVLPIWAAHPVSTESAAGFDEVFLNALQRERRFEVVALTREDCLRRFRREALPSSGALPTNLLGALKAEFAADGVMFLDLTVYSAYKPIAIGLRAKLASIDGARLVWAFDNVFATDEPAVANAARRHFLDRDKAVPLDLTPAALQSPSRFAAYVAAATFATLPPPADPLAEGGGN